MQMRKLRGERRCLMALQLIPMMGCELCGEDAQEEVEVSTFVFKHVVVEFGLYWGVSGYGIVRKDEI